MTKLFCKNRDKYKEDLECLVLYSLGVDKETKKPFYCNPLRKRCEKCLFEPKLGSCEDQAYEWLEDGYKEPIKLTEAERVILENIDKKWKWIARDENGNIYLYNEKPKKSDTMYIYSMKGKMRSFSMFEHIFKFIKWEDEEPYNITELLETCEVEDE